MADEQNEHPDSGAVVDDYSWEQLVKWAESHYAAVNQRFAEEYLTRWYQAEMRWKNQPSAESSKLPIAAPALMRHVVPDRANAQINIVKGQDLVMPKLPNPWDIPPPNKPPAGTVDVAGSVFPDGSLYRIGPRDTTVPGDTTVINGVTYTHIAGGFSGLAKYWARPDRLSLFGG